MNSDVYLDITTSHAGNRTPRQFLEGAKAGLHNI